MKPQSPVEHLSTGPAEVSNDQSKNFESQSEGRVRILFFGCRPADALRALKQNNGIPVALLSSYDLKEILEEIGQFKPTLVACCTDFFLDAISASLHPLPAGAVLLPPATPREMKILSMLVQGKTNDEMARILHLSPRTVKRTLSSLFERVGVSNRTELSSFAASRGSRLKTC
jgi:DNA-binding CsgD family transcriptional regulator